MKLIKTASGKRQLKISRKEWEKIGKQAGWRKQAQLEEWQGEKIKEYISELWNRKMDINEKIIMANEAWERGDIEYFKTIGVL